MKQHRPRRNDVDDRKKQKKKSQLKMMSNFIEILYSITLLNQH